MTPSTRPSRLSSKRRKATWLGFCVVALATLSTARKDDAAESSPFSHPSTSPAPMSTSGILFMSQQSTVSAAYRSDNEAEADKAYQQALLTLANIPAYSATQSPGFIDAQPNSILTTLFPNQQGPIASVIRIILKLRQQTWVPQFLSAGIGKDGWATGKKKEELHGKALKVIDLLQHAIDLGHADALYKLAYVSLFHLSPLLHNPTRAYESYLRHAELTGNATSQSMIAFYYATGYDNVVDVDQAKALLYYTFAGHGGDQGAQMSLGYRHWAGISVNDDCMHSLEWYQLAAGQSMTKFMSGPPGGLTLLHTTTRLSDLDGGVYGSGASVASTGLNAHRPVIRAASARQAGETWEDVLEYYIFNADRGETDFAFRLGKIFYQGSIYPLPGGAASGGEGVGAVPRDYGRARSYFLRIARQIWPRDAPGVPAPPVKQEHKTDGTLSYAVASAGYLGRMFLRGEGVKQDTVMARMWFERGAQHSEKECHNGLGLIWRDGLVDGKRDLKKAVYHFNIAANHDLAEALVNLGKYNYQKGDIKLAMEYFDSAIRNGSPFEPYYYLAEIHGAAAKNPATPAHHVQGSCAMAASFYKLVAERGAWGEDFVREGEALWRVGTESAKEDAMLRWWVASERGIEAAQNNLAYTLDQDKSILRLTRFAPSTPSNTTARLALTQWLRSAHQRNVDALVKVGDYYYHGLGVADEPESARWERAAAFYQSAVDTQLSALAMWNLGWMYENGIGVPQDFHLAKRHYDLALETNKEAYLPVILSLMKLYVRSIWHTLMGGKNGLSFWPGGVTDPKEGIAESIGTGAESGEVNQAQQAAEEYYENADDSQWYMGKARDDHRKRMSAAAAAAASEQRGRGNDLEDPIQWARDRRNAEAERDSDFGPDDFFESVIRGPGRRERRGGEAGGGVGNGAGGDGDGLENSDDFAETMLLVMLCLAVSVLMYVRGRWVERRRREEEETRARANDDNNNNGAGMGADAQNAGGLFPPQGDPARQEWAVLR